LDVPVRNPVLTGDQGHTLFRSSIVAPVGGSANTTAEKGKVRWETKKEEQDVANESLSVREFEFLAVCKPVKMSE